MKQLITKIKEFINSKKITLLKFYAKWCFPCKELKKTLKKIKKKFKKNIKLISIDIDENLDISNKYDIQSVPTILIYKNKKNIKTIIGSIDYKYLKKKINKIL
ncbi:MAG: thioredoxin family protein [Candidatus Shikimatogenerans sp. AspAUS03]|uniref:Thioredoxin n=1 Tax=Candidatus Shikimatogenerans sp. AspAUS03 TaxID=3158563 RepID=A0AAU7QSW4_9FLAO